MGVSIPPDAPNGTDAFVQALHAAYQSGHLPTQMAAKTATDPERYAADRDPYASFGDRLAAMAQRGTQGIPGGQQVMTGTRAAITGEPWNVASRHVQQDAEVAGQNAPGLPIPQVLGGDRLTLADLPAFALGSKIGQTALRAATAPMSLAEALSHAEPVQGGSIDAIIDQLEREHGLPSTRGLPLSAMRAPR